MSEIAIIGGSGFTKLSALEITRKEVSHTPYGEPSAPLTHGVLHGRQVVFLPRHGTGHTIPPHQINYRANLWALRHLGVKQVIAIAAVGGIGAEMAPGKISIPDQVVDYTYGREHTFFDFDLSQVTHIDFTHPYSETLRQQLIDAAERAGVDIVPHGVYGATQGPRLETAMEINRLERDGCSLVGMTGMPETALAKELDMEYACCAVVANRAAGRSDIPITMRMIETHMASGMQQVLALLEKLLANP